MEGILAVYDQRPDLREHLAYLLAWFPAVYPATMQRLRLAGISGILALGLLERQLEAPSTTTHLLTHPDLTVRTAAAIASARASMDPTVEKVLKEGLECLDQLQPTLFNAGDWRGWIGCCSCVSVEFKAA